MSTKSDVEISKSKDNRQPCLSSYCIAVTNLSSKALVRLVKNSVSMRCDCIDVARMSLTENIDYLSDIMAILHIDKGIIKRGCTLKAGKTAHPLFRIGIGLSSKELKTAASDVAIGYVKAIKRGAGHDTKD